MGNDTKCIIKSVTAVIVVALIAIVSGTFLLFIRLEVLS